MELFGKEISDIDLPPFLIKTIEEGDNGVRFVVALSARGEIGTVGADVGNDALYKVLQKAAPIYPDESNIYEILFENYVFHMTRNESFTFWDEYEIRKGKYFIVFERSRLLDCLPQLVEMGIVEAYNKEGRKHYGIYCHNHIIDVIAMGEPKITRYSKDS